MNKPTKKIDFDTAMSFYDDGVYVVDYKGYRITSTRPEHKLWTVSSIDGSELPKVLGGHWTSRDEVRRKIDALPDLERREKAKLAKAKPLTPLETVVAQAACIFEK